jgi:hypothetical protein
MRQSYWLAAVNCSPLPLGLVEIWLLLASLLWLLWLRISSILWMLWLLWCKSLLRLLIVLLLLWHLLWLLLITVLLLKHLTLYYAACAPHLKELEWLAVITLHSNNLANGFPFFFSRTVFLVFACADY